MYVHVFGEKHFCMFNANKAFVLYCFYGVAHIPKTKNYVKETSNLFFMRIRLPASETIKQKCSQVHCLAKLCRSDEAIMAL